jgi:hypothetical protein
MVSVTRIAPFCSFVRSPPGPATIVAVALGTRMESWTVMSYKARLKILHEVLSTQFWMCPNVDQETNQQLNYGNDR